MLLVYLAVVVFSVTSNALYQNIEGVLYDGLIRSSLGDEPETRVILVDIDEKSLSTEGAWPWPRAKLAMLINRLTRDYQVGVLGIDIVFPEAREDDARLIQALHHDNIVMSQVLDFNPDSTNQTGQFVAIPEKFEGSIKPSVTGYIANHPSLVAAKPNVAHITPTIDLDGKVRRIYPIACGSMGCTPTLSLKMLDVIHGGAPLKREKIGRILNTQWSNDDYLTLHLDQEDQLFIPFALKTNAFTSIPAHEVLHLNAPKVLLKNAIVILGSTSMGLGDYVATPVSNLTPGLTLHAEIISAFLDDRLISPNPSPVWFWISLAMVGILFLIWPSRSPRALFAWALLVSLIFIVSTLILFDFKQIIIPLTPIPLMTGLILFLGLILESISTNRQLKLVASQFSRFIPESLVKRLLKGRDVSPSTKKRELTVLVADMRGFTTASEGRDSDAVAELAQKCLSALTDVVYQHGGTIEKYSGDGLMAVWGAPNYDPQHAAHAVAAGIDMQKAILNLKDWFIEHEFKPMRVSIGINTGEGSVGVFGGEAHLAWTAHGDAVNVASRIEQLTRQVGYDLLIGERTQALYGGVNVIDCGEYAVKGRTGQVRVFAIENKE